jgi:hypothetical protein
VTNVYIRPRYEVVHVNRTVIHRTVNYDNLRPYNAVHRTVDIGRGRGPGNGRGNGGNYGRDDDRRVVDNRPGDIDRRGGDNGRGNDRGSTQPRGYVQYPDRVEQREVERRQPVQGSVTYNERPQVVAPSRQPTRQPTTQPQARTERPRIVTPPVQGQVNMPSSRQPTVRQPTVRQPTVRQPSVRSANIPTQRVESRPPTRQSNGNGGGWSSQPSRAPSGSVSPGRAPTVTRQAAPPSSSVRSAPRGQVSAPSGKAKGKGS